MKPYSYLTKVWVKDPKLKGHLAIVSSCLLNKETPELAELLSGRTVLDICPETTPRFEQKVTMILKCSSPKSLIVVTREGSPHCFLVHAAVNAAFFATSIKTPVKHYVYVQGRLVEVTSEAVRVARYLSLVNYLVERNPNIIEKLVELSLEQKASKKTM